jgi:hypothetical protein
MDYGKFFFFSIAIILDLLASQKLMNSKRLSTKVINTNLVLTWLVPYVWAVIVLSSSNEPPKKTGKHEKFSYMSTGYPQG